MRCVDLKSFVKIIITASVTAAVTFSATSVLYLSRQSEMTELSLSSKELKTKIDSINTYIDNNYLYDDVDYEKANTAAIKAYVESLEEPYTHYYSKDEFDKYISNVEESYVGIGIIISADIEADKLVVISPIKGSPAYEADIKPGDYIIAVDGEKFNSSQMDSCVSKIKGGKEGTDVTITVERDGETKDYNIERREIIENSVRYEMLDNKIGYVTISSFNTNRGSSKENTYTEFKEAIDNLTSDGMKKLIIDVRDNPGGVLNVVCQISDYLLPEGVITYTETRKGEKKEYKSDEKCIDVPIAMLINGSSASASEILAGALKDYDRAVIVGQTSYGKGIVQNVFPFSDGSGMSMTVSKYFTPNGTSIHGVGVEPDVEVALPDEYADSFVSQVPRGQDTQLQKAIELLNDK